VILKFSVALSLKSKKRTVKSIHSSEEREREKAKLISLKSFRSTQMFPGKMGMEAGNGMKLLLA